MEGFLIITLVVLWFGGLYLLFRYVGKQQANKLLDQVRNSRDVEFLIKHLGSAYKPEINKAAEESLNRIARTTGNPQEFFRLSQASYIKPENIWYSGRHYPVSDADLLLKVAPKVKPDRAVWEGILARISDEDILADIAESYSVPGEICREALARITDQDLLLGIALKSGWQAAADRLDEEHLNQWGEEMCRKGSHAYQMIDRHFESGEYDNDRHYEIVTYKCSRCGNVKTEEHLC